MLQEVVIPEGFIEITDEEEKEIIIEFAKRNEDFAKWNENRKRINKLKQIWETRKKPCKVMIKQEEIDQLKFHIHNLFQGVSEHKYIVFSYVHEIQDDRKPLFKFWSFKIGDISDDVLKRILLLSRRHIVYISQNSFRRPRRLSENAYASKAFILDIDYYNVDEYKNLTPSQMIKVMELDGMFDVIKPSYALGTGRGLSLVYIFENPLPLALNNRVKSLRTHIANYMIKAFAPYGADASGKDLARINKIPGSTTQNISEKNVIKEMRLVSNISADEFTTSREFLAEIKQNILEWEIFHDEIPFWKEG